MEMNTVLALSLFWCLYGLAGLLGWQHIPARHKGRPWTKRYIRTSGLGWLLLGLPVLIFERYCASVAPNLPFTFGRAALILLALSLPSILFTTVTERKYSALLKQEDAAGPKKE